MYSLLAFVLSILVIVAICKWSGQKAIKITGIVILCICALAAAGFGYLQYHEEQNNKAYEAKEAKRKADELASMIKYANDIFDYENTEATLTYDDIVNKKKIGEEAAAWAKDHLRKDDKITDMEKSQEFAQNYRVAHHLDFIYAVKGDMTRVKRAISLSKPILGKSDVVVVSVRNYIDIDNAVKLINAGQFNMSNVYSLDGKKIFNKRKNVWEDSSEWEKDQFDKAELN